MFEGIVDNAIDFNDIQAVPLRGDERLMSFLFNAGR
jgi:hypothetical protein